MELTGRVGVGSVVMLRNGAAVRLHSGRDLTGRGAVWDFRRPGAYGYIPHPLPEGTSDLVPLQVHGFIARTKAGRSFMALDPAGVDVVRLASVPADSAGCGDASFVSVAVEDVVEAWTPPPGPAPAAADGARALAEAFGDGQAQGALPN